MNLLFIWSKKKERKIGSILRSFCILKNTKGSIVLNKLTHRDRRFMCLCVKNRDTDGHILSGDLTRITNSKIKKDIPQSRAVCKISFVFVFTFVCVKPSHASRAIAM